MAERELEAEVKRIFEHIEKGENFLLSGGAGSGKTYSMVQVIGEIIQRYPKSKIACMTYTNAAVREIESRIDHSNLNVTTIHDFLWDNIKFFQNEIKKTLIELIRDENSEIKSNEADISDNYFDDLEDGIQYKEWTSIKDGIISHDAIIELSNLMFKTYPKLCDILKDKFKFILIDEYQDTHSLVIEIFLTHFKQSKKNTIIGFFGDAMQSIYDETIGDLKPFVQSGAVMEVKKAQNRRNPKLIIELANRLRTDGLVQEPSTDQNAPNMSGGLVKEGTRKFLYSTVDNLETLKSTDIFNGWNFDDSKQTKELNLTHNLIAPKAGFPNLMAIYNRDRIIELKNRLVGRIKEENRVISENATFGDVIDLINMTIPPASVMAIFLRENPELLNEARQYPFSVFRKIYVDSDILTDDKKQDEDDESKKGSKRDSLIKHLFKIQTNIYLYRTKQFNLLLRKTEFPIRRIQDKRNLKLLIENIDGMSESTIGEVIEYANEQRICLKDDGFNKFVVENEYVYNRVKKVKYLEFQNLFNYLEGFTPFSTQHKTKGTEFDNVLVILNNGNWTSYNFEYLFNNSGNPSVLARTQKIFYVCCTRTKENLIVYYHNPSPSVITKAKAWFGVSNVISV